MSEVLSPGFVLNRWNRAQCAAGLDCSWRHRSCVDDSAAGFVHCLMSSEKMSTSERCWFLRGAQQQHDSSVFRALCQQSPFVSACPVDMCAFGLPIRKRFTLFSVNVLVHLKLTRRCDNFGNVCSFSGKAHRQLGSCFCGHFFHRAHRVRYATIVARALVHSFHAKDSWTNKQRLLV